MGRMLWVAVGAAGGVLAYRRGQQLLQGARERGLVGSVQVATGTAAGLAGQARTAITPLLRPARPMRDDAATPSRASGAAAARALAESRRAGAAAEGRPGAEQH